MINYTEEQMNKMRDVSIATLCGKPSNGRKQVIACPHGNRDTTPSCYIFPDNGFKCFSCGKRGNNAIDFLLSFEGSEFKDVLDELSKYI
jgi:DNA primase